MSLVYNIFRGSVYMGFGIRYFDLMTETFESRPLENWSVKFFVVGVYVRVVNFFFFFFHLLNDT